MCKSRYTDSPILSILKQNESGIRLYIVCHFISIEEFYGAYKLPLTLNRYLYANADPLNTVDPSGMFKLLGVKQGSFENISLRGVR